MARKKKRCAFGSQNWAVEMKKILSSKKPLQEKRKPRCMVLSGFGLNSERELANAFTLAGADPYIIHFSDISSGKQKLSDFQIFAIPGGWSFGDDIASGKVLANKLKSTFRNQFEEFASSGKPILGICNGFQVLVKLGALPNLSGRFEQEATLASNASGRFEDRWVYLKPQKSACKYFEGVDFIHCPVRHGEGRFIARDQAILSLLERNGQIALKYADEKLQEASDYPENPNGSQLNIAGVCDKTGKILGLMPHPECSVYRFHFPRWTAGISHEKNSLRFFENIVREAEKHL
ncbi:MAG: phosphoribosylformylglycinamidine synthase subunit PurQ [Candidatus Anstonellaceae archaeon]